MKGQRVYRWLDGYPKEWELQEKGFIQTFCRGISRESKAYYFKPFFHESPRHAILIFEIIDYIEKTWSNLGRKIKVQEFLSKKPDIVLTINKKEFAFEIETGIVLKRNYPQFQGKLANLKYYYRRNWFFVVTDRNLVKLYKRYGKTLTKRNIFRKIDKIIFENL